MVDDDGLMGGGNVSDSVFLRGTESKSTKTDRSDHFNN